MHDFITRWQPEKQPGREPAGQFVLSGLLAPATIGRHLGIDPQFQEADTGGRPTALNDGKPIAELYYT